LEDGDPSTASGSFTTDVKSGSRSGRHRPSVSGRWRREGELSSGSKIGRYVVLYRLGQGGMGVVYAAYDPQLDRKVAVKLLRTRARKSEHDETRGRMLREAQALARPSHPHVVAVHDAGLLDGRVFVAMDFVDGETLRRWLKSKSRTRREILDAYVQAGDALVAAHAADIVHRDFKPDNAIVGRDGRVQVLDFGLARLQSDTPADGPRPPSRGPSGDAKTRPGTQGNRRQGTPAYMAPEQHDRERIGPAADQYALCVSLWEALCERAPFAGKDDTLVANIKAGSFTEPARGKLSGHLRRILRRGLAADPKARYPSMRALLVDLRRDPRRRWRRAGMVLGIVTIAGASAAGYAQWSAAPAMCSSGDERLAEVWNDEQRGRIDRAIGRASRGHVTHTREAVGRGLDEYATRWRGAYTEACEATHVRHEQSETLLDLRMGCLGGRLKNLGAVATLLGEADEDVVDRALATVDGLPSIERCADVVALRERQPLPRDPNRRQEIEATRTRLAHTLALNRAGRQDEAATGARSASRRAKELGYQPLVAQAGFALGTTLETQGEFAEAREVLLAAEVAAEVARDDPLLADIRILLIMVEGDRLGDADHGRIWARLARATLERIGGDKGQEAMLENNLALALEHEARPEELLVHQRRAIELAEEAGLSELRRAKLYNNLAGTLAQTGNFDEALKRAQQARLTWEHSLGTQHHGLAVAMATIGYVYDRRGDTREALQWYERGYSLMVQELGEDNPRTADILGNLAISQASLGKLDEAERSFLLVLSLREKALGPDHIEVARAHGNLGVLYSRRGRREEGLREQRRALAIKERALGSDHPLVASSLEEVANVLEKLERHSETIPLRMKALGIRERVYGPDHPRLATAVANLAHNHLMVNEVDRALVYAKRALLLADDPSVTPVDRAFTRLVLAVVLDKKGGESVRVRELFDLAQEAVNDAAAPSERKLLAELAKKHGWEVIARPPPSEVVEEL